MTITPDRHGNAGRSPSDRFEVHVEPDRDVVHVQPAGELDIATAPLLRRCVDELVASGFTHLEIDLRVLEFIDCSGLRLLLALDADARSDGWRLTLVQGHDAVQRLFTLTGTGDALPFAAGDGLGRRG